MTSRLPGLLLCLALAAALTAGPARAEEPDPGGGAALRPLARLSGSCWKGGFPGGGAFDEHCFEWAYGGWYLRDRHVVTGAPAPYSGETLYRWEAATHRIEFDYWNSDGDKLTGWVEDHGDSLVFPETLGGERHFRTVWRYRDENAYVVATSESVGGAWVERFAMEMKRSRPAPAGPLALEAPAAPAALAAAADSLAASGLKIAYNVYTAESGDYDVWIMDADGSNRRNLTNSPGTDWVYTAREGRLYFVSRRGMTERGYHLYSMDADGGGVRRISRDPVPDSFVDARRGGAEIVISDDRDGHSELVVVNPAGRDRLRLTRDALADLDPAYSPDGSRIAWRHGPRRREEIWVMNADGTGRRALTAYPPSDSTPNVHVYRAGPPRWSPDGAWISFGSHRRGHYDVWAVRPDGKDLHRVTRSPADECWHDWSPDGRWLVLDLFDGVESDIVLMPAAGGERLRLTRGGPSEQCPVFVRAPEKTSRRAP